MCIVLVSILIHIICEVRYCTKKEEIDNDEKCYRSLQNNYNNTTKK